MTTPPPDHLRLVTPESADGPHRLRIEIHGDLDYDNADLLLEEVTAQLSARARVADLHLHCGAIGTVDSMGLATLLMIGRRTAAAGVRLHLDDRPAKLDRLLTITGTLDHFTAPAAAGTAPDPGTAPADPGAAPAAAAPAGESRRLGAPAREPRGDVL